MHTNTYQDKKRSLKFFSGSFWVNKYLLIFVFIYILGCIGGTYAYFALSVSDNETVVGVAGEVDLGLDVEQVIPSSNNDSVMVPQLESALGTAISSTYNCVDGNGNIVCKVFSATVTNNSSANVRVKGTVSFTGINSLPNLKWKRIQNASSIGSYSSKKASSSDVSFESERLLEIDESTTYYFVVWIDEIGRPQTDSGTFVMNVKFNSINGNGISSTFVTPFIDEVMAVNAVSDKDIDFTQTSEESDTNGIYYIDEIKDNVSPIYYYRGNVNNNLIFADTCWKIVRTTETGGLKLIYNGLPSNGQCNNTGDSSQIGLTRFNSSNNSPAYVGYMYGTPYIYDYKVMNNDTTGYVYGNNVTYSGGSYTLSDTISSSSWASIYNGGLNNNHYTCFTTGNKCTSVYYIYYTNTSRAYYITLNDGKIVVDALMEMLDNNNTSSAIKENSTTEGTLDYWYYTNIEQAGYSSYIEDTVWCNDRSIGILNGWDPDG